MSQMVKKNAKAISEGGTPKEKKAVVSGKASQKKQSFFKSQKKTYNRGSSNGSNSFGSGSSGSQSKGY